MASEDSRYGRCDNNIKLDDIFNLHYFKIDLSWEVWLMSVRPTNWEPEAGELPLYFMLSWDT